MVLGLAFAFAFTLEDSHEVFLIRLLLKLSEGHILRENVQRLLLEHVGEPRIKATHRLAGLRGRPQAWSLHK